MKTNETDRRSFIVKAGLGTLAAFSIPEIAMAAFEVDSFRRLSLKTGDTILMQGDSITDAGRKRKATEANDQSAMGGGYAFLAAAEMLVKHPDKSLQFYNRGISGNKVYQLADTWDADTISLKPDVLSILVGINDYWHTLSHGYKGTVDTYQKDYRALLQRTKDKLPDVKLVIGEPFAIIGTAVNETWFPVLREYQAVARELANDFGAAFVPYQKVYDKALKHAPGAYWSGDGVHPTVAGASLMAHAWLQAIK